jgi:hypothetical protein
MLTKALLSRRINRHVDLEMYDVSEGSICGVAVYKLVDPRDLRQTRYVGQTSQPRRRFLQHLNTARLWFPEERPWWVKSPAGTSAAARLLERMQIFECLAKRLPLLNVESERSAPQLPLL